MNIIRTHSQARPLVKGVDIRNVWHRNQPWYDAYMAALFEPNIHQALEKLRSAEKLMLEREREIHDDNSAFAERRALDKALEALRALRLCLNLQR